MKTQIYYGPRMCALSALCLAFVAGVAEAKPGKGNGKGDAPGHSEKGKGGKHDNKSHEKAKKEFGKDFEKANKQNEKEAKEFAKWREKRFRDEDRRSVVEYFGKYRDNDHGLPPGLAKNLRRGKPLPPGWQKKMVPGYIIEDEFNDDFYPLNYGLFPGMEVVPDTKLYRYGDRIVRVYEPRREIIDVIPVPTIRFD